MAQGKFLSEAIQSGTGGRTCRQLQVHCDGLPKRVVRRGDGHNPRSLFSAPPEAVLGISHYMHGEVCRVKPDSTAFPLRQSGGIHIRIGFDWEDPAKAQGFMLWADEARRRLRRSSGERIYANYQSYAGKGTPEAVFGSNYSPSRTNTTPPIFFGETR